MATAREQLHTEIVALSNRACDDAGKADLQKILLGFRVQTKAGTQIPDGMTARDALGAEVVTLWEKGPIDADTCTALINRFRMQLKAAAGAKKAPRKKAAAAKPAARKAAPAAPVQAPPKAKKAEAAPVARRTPIGGGPMKRRKTRAECPKCHSNGVVLAHNYAGEEYYSCIYCGWQAYKSTTDSDLDATLAAQLLGRATRGGT